MSETPLHEESASGTEASPVPVPAVRWALRLASAGAMALALYLLWAGLSEAGPAGCAPGSSCGAVLASPWAKWLSLPVSLGGAVVYAVMLGAAVALSPHRPVQQQRVAWLVLLAASAAAAGAAAWFVAVQAGWVGEICRWCMTTHALGLSVAVLTLFAAPVGRGNAHSIRPRAGATAALLGLVPVAVLIIGQVAAPADPGLAALQQRTAMKGGQMVVSLPGNRHVVLPADELPRLGPSDAPVKAVYLFDYTCGHCRTTHGYLEEAVAHYQGKLAVLMLPVPLDADCNKLVERTQPAHESACELAELALAVWQAEPGAFAEFDRWLSEGELPPTVEAARARAEALAGAEALDRALASAWVQQQVGRTVPLYEMTGPQPLPVILAGNLLLTGEPNDTQDLIQALEDGTALGDDKLAPPDATAARR